MESTMEHHHFTDTQLQFIVGELGGLLALIAALLVLA